MIPEIDIDRPHKHKDPWYSFKGIAVTRTEESFLFQTHSIPILSKLQCYAILNRIEEMTLDPAGYYSCCFVSDKLAKYIESFFWRFECESENSQMELQKVDSFFKICKVEKGDDIPSIKERIIDLDNGILYTNASFREEGYRAYDTFFFLIVDFIFESIHPKLRDIEI